MSKTQDKGVTGVFRFEAVGFVNTRRQLEALDKIDRDFRAVWPKVTAKAAEHGFTAVKDVYLTEDDEQGSTDIKVFVVVKLEGTSTLKENACAPYELNGVLNELAATVCCNGRGRDIVDPENWEMVEMEYETEAAC